MRQPGWTAFLLIILLGVACQEAGEPAPAATSSTEADVEAIRELTRQYDAAVNAGSVDDLMALYAEDAVQIPPNEPVSVGKQAIRSRVEALFRDYTDALSSRVETVRVSGDLASLRGSFTEPVTSKASGETVTYEGSWVVIFQRQSGRPWRIVTEMWNNTAPGNAP